MDPLVDYLKLACSIETYKVFGYTYIDVPWKVSLKYQNITRPLLADGDDAEFVGSAEQSFLSLDLQGHLREGRYVACTPCMRNEPVHDELHLPYFMKVELYRNFDCTVDNLNLMISDAYLLMSNLMTGNDTLTTVKTEDGYDIELNGVEVGSYGIRSHGSHRWIYGTGLAEPRFSTALNIGLRNHYKDFTDGT